MQTVILAGGLGTRLGEETGVRPKPLVEIGGKPVLWHIMKIYSAAGLHNFIICLGYKGYMIKEYFANYFLHTSDVTIDLRNGSCMRVHNSQCEPWQITLVETGDETMTGGRLGAIRPHLDPGSPFCFTYGDGVADIDIADLVKFHRNHGARATITAVAPFGRFGALELDEDRVLDFREKPAGTGDMINGGFFVADPSVLDLIEGPDTVWEHGPMTSLALGGELKAYRHHGFWHPMDTLRDKQQLEQLWNTGAAPWKRW